jgi:hypothetical protein
MKRGLWLIFAALAMIAATVLFRDDPEPVGANEPAPVPQTAPATVRVSHEFVTVPIPAAPATRVRQPSTTRPRTVPATHTTTGATGRRDAVKASNRNPGAATARPAPDGRNLLERAGRAFIGDGKYRPQPFPRVR